jgi:hypothetical protein
VVATPSQQVGTFSVLDAARFGKIMDRETANVRISENVNDMFVRNLVVLLCEKRMTLVIELPTAAVTGSLNYAG